MPHSCRDDQDVSSPDLHLLPLFAAQMQKSRAAVNTKHFMRGTMIMMKGIDPITPGVGPVIAGKFLFQPGSAVCPARIKRISVYQEREFAIGDFTVVGKKEFLRLRPGRL